jgi:hypothetical protein
VSIAVHAITVAASTVTGEGHITVKGKGCAERFGDLWKEYVIHFEI